MILFRGGVMNSKKWSGIVFALVAGFALLAAGCKDTGKDGKEQAQKKAEPKEDEDWWCKEHGVPEEVCTLCDVKLRAKIQARPQEWCALHKRAKNICFKCDPKLQEKWAQAYRDKYNKEPPEITEPEEVFEKK